MKPMPKPTLSPEANARLLMPRAHLAQARAIEAEYWADPNSTFEERAEMMTLRVEAERAFQQALVRELVGA